MVEKVPILPFKSSTPMEEAGLLEWSLLY